MEEQREMQSDFDAEQPPREAVKIYLEGRLTPRNNRGKKPNPEAEDEDFLALLPGSDPVKIKINRLENEIKDKDRELNEAQSKIRALKLADRSSEKALAELTEELNKMVEKLKISEATIDNKNLEIKKIVEEKKEALAAQFATEAILRRVHSTHKDEELPPLEVVLSPLEAEIKRLRQEVSKLQDDNKALERMTKTKETALLEAEKEVRSAKVRIAQVDDLLNRNQELMKQNEICQEECKILDRMHRQKVTEVEKLSSSIRQLEEALLSGAMAANAVRDYQRQLSKIKEENKLLERTLSRAKVKENRVAAVAANEWKEVDDKKIPVKQWFDERRVLLGEMQQLRERLAVSERAIRTETQLKEKLRLRLKVVEDSMRIPSLSGPCSPTILDAEMKPTAETSRDVVSGALYDVLQREVISLRSACQEKDNNLKDKEAAINVLLKKVETLTRAMEVEAKKTRREKASMEKEMAVIRAEVESEQRLRRSNVIIPRTPHRN